jgi:hypothetical protein
MRMPRLSGLLLLLCGLAATGGCGSGSAGIECSPACPSGLSCTAAGCVPDQVAGVDLSVVAPPDQGGCSPACSGATPFCEGGLCVACVGDSSCPAGQVCRTLGKVKACLAGCADDSRCAGLGMGANLRCCSGACVDVTSDPSNCGACGAPCSSSNAIDSCVSGSCVTSGCRAGFGDCNHDPGDGCEVNLGHDPANCGACGTTCHADHASTGCSLGCYLHACDFGWDDCNQTAADGCEMNVLSDPKNCGGCGQSCPAVPNATAGCDQANCRLDSCNVGFADCNGQVADGCEVPTSTDTNNCGSCGKVCPPMQVCVNGGCTCKQCNIPNARTKCNGLQCVFDRCVAGFGDCNHNLVDGCELDLSRDPNNCGACANVCPIDAPHCFAGACQAQPPGVLLGTINGQDYYKVQVMGAMTDTNVAKACMDSGFNVPCQAQPGCMYNDKVCVPTQENSCGNPMLVLAKTLCAAQPPQCPALYGCYQYMGHNWNGDSACGAEMNSWCSAGNGQMNKFAVCVF